jgi:hypothetical protein
VGGVMSADVIELTKGLPSQEKFQLMIENSSSILISKDDTQSNVGFLLKPFVAFY